MTGEPMSIKVMFAGGGTGGHVYPAVAIHEGLVDRLGAAQVDAMFVGVKGGLEATLLPQFGHTPTLLPGRGIRGASLSDKFLVPLDLARGVTAGLRMIRAFRPDVVVGTGGYASVSTVVAAMLSRTPRILQEQNSVLGLTNRRLARFADMVLLSYDSSRKEIPEGVEFAVIGNPLRKIAAVDRGTGARHFGMDPARPTVLVMGGSRGAHSLNEAALGAIRELPDTQFILLTGERNFEGVNDAITDAESDGGRVAVRAYVDEMHLAYSAADVAVARAGASSVFELAAIGLPTIFVPYPYAADDHQRLNVEPLLEVGGAVMIPDAELDPARLALELRSLLGNADRISGMSDAMRSWSRPAAAEEAAVRIIELVKKNAYAGREYRQLAVRFITETSERHT
jgi:UDP-N-acetylglucosamine--N-acetylmuramyl-(pentapeptide) pyrophosphoryl-undecaprenol N-acetylglucosamine transferase